MTEIVSQVPNTTLALGVVLALVLMPLLARLRRILFWAAAIALVIHLL